MAGTRSSGILGGTGAAAAVLCALMAGEGLAQAQAAATSANTAAAPATAVATKMEFDVASVRPSNSDERQDANFPLGPGDVYVPNGGNFIAAGMPLIVYIYFAYKVSANQAPAIQKQLPGWVMTERYDITAKTDNHDAGKDDMRMMMRSLLADRFKLAVHSETQQVPVFGLVVAKAGVLGPKLQTHPADQPCDNTPPKPAEDGKEPSFTLSSGFPVICGGIFGMPPSAPGLIAFGARDVTMDLIANLLTGPANLGKPVLDQTGLKGKYDFLLEFAQDRRPAPGPGADMAAPLDTAGPGIEEALKQQLGLKLESTKGPVEVWIVDHVEHPTAN